MLEYRIVAITLYNGKTSSIVDLSSSADGHSELLKDEVSATDYVGPTLQSLKKLLEDPPVTVAGKARYEKVIHAILSAAMLNIDAMRYAVSVYDRFMINYVI